MRLFLFFLNNPRASLAAIESFLSPYPFNVAKAPFQAFSEDEKKKEIEPMAGIIFPNLHQNIS